ncbi:transposable element Tcb1 transposase [Trichonephila clavipes]|nr:transposable element Tcb1 transposase [Trichonephila clavipes]
MREGTTEWQVDRIHLSAPLHRERRQIVRMAVTNRSVISRTVAQHIESATHHSVIVRVPFSARLKKNGLSTRLPLLGLPLTQNHRRLLHERCVERRMWGGQNGMRVVFY